MNGTLYSNKVKYYRCQRKTKGFSCKMPNVKEELIIEDLLRNFEKYVQGWVEVSSVKEKDGDDKIKDIRAELETIEKQMKKYKIMFVNDLIDIEELNANITKLRNREKELKEELNKDEKKDRIWTSEELEALIESFPKLWNEIDDDERKLLMASIFDEIIIDADENAKFGPGNHKPFWIVSVK